MNDSRSDANSTTFESLAALELPDLHASLPVLDAMLKEAPVELLSATPIPPGRFVIVVTGRVGEVESSYRRGLEIAGPPVDHLFLPEAHTGILPAVGRTRNGLDTRFYLSGGGQASAEALAFFETSSICSGLHAADRVLKETSVELASLHMARGISGKSFGVLTGRQDMIEAAVEIAERAAHYHDNWVGATILPRPDEALVTRILSSPWGFLGGQEIL